MGWFMFWSRGWYLPRIWGPTEIGVWWVYICFGVTSHVLGMCVTACLSRKERGLKVRPMKTIRAISIGKQLNVFYWSDHLASWPGLFLPHTGTPAKHCDPFTVGATPAIFEAQSTPCIVPDKKKTEMGWKHFVTFFLNGSWCIPDTHVEIWGLSPSDLPPARRKY